jgi:hypothetical protein
MTEPHVDVPRQSLLTRTEAIELERTIEAGLPAHHVRVSGAGFADATDEELGALEAQGEWARQRFIRANLGLVGMVSRPYATRSQLPEADLFQEGCVGLPACQLPTGSSPCTSLSANSSIMLRWYSSIVSILSPWMPAMRSRRPGESVRRSARASGHLLRGLRGCASTMVRWSATRAQGRTEESLGSVALS